MKKTCAGWMLACFVVACGPSDPQPADLEGVWEGFGETADGEALTLQIEILAPGAEDDGLWQFLDREGEGWSIIQDDRRRNIDIELRQVDPCPGTYRLEGIELQTGVIEASFGGEDDCRGHLQVGTLLLERE